MNKSLIIFGIVNITSDSFSDGGRYLAPDAAIAQARKLMAEGADVIDLGPASSNPDAAPVSSDTEIARIAPVLDALKADGIPSRSTVINPRRKPMPCRVVWPISMIFAVFQTLRSIRNWRNHLPNSSLCIRCKTGRQIGARHPLATSWITLRRSLTRASRR
ncbi:hypothetical protein CHD73_23985 (plasmid) [Salmonella enterica subsp. enterica serovar Manhattan]|nr:hypothetical protein CHD73_23985 [Salmonella enterica subsp. enterica serovar Manhattan]